MLLMAFTIYVLKDPSGEIRYVGKTMTTLANRMSAHLCEAKKGNRVYVYNWIRSILKAGNMPVISAIETGEVGDGSEQERKWIAHGRSSGWRLTNLTDGGEGSGGHFVSKKQRKRMSEFMKKPENRMQLQECVKRMGDEERSKLFEKISQGQKRRYSSTAARLKTAEATKLSWKKRYESPDYEASCKKVSDAHKERFKDPEERRKISEATKAAMQDPAVLKKLSDASKQRFADPVKRAKQSETIRRAWQDPEKRARMMKRWNKA
jgi:hypothetical protein